jgi:hypothetical protein
MFRTKSRRNIRSKRVISRKNRNLSRRMKGGDPTEDEAVKLNSGTLCKYYVLVDLWADGDVKKDVIDKAIDKLKLYQIKRTPDVPNPISWNEFKTVRDEEVLSLYMDDRVSCPFIINTFNNV